MKASKEFNGIEVWVECAGERLNEFDEQFQAKLTRQSPICTAYLEIGNPSCSRYTFHVKNTNPQEWLGDLMSDVEIDDYLLCTAFLKPEQGYEIFHGQVYTRNSEEQEEIHAQFEDLNDDTSRITLLNSPELNLGKINISVWRGTMYKRRSCTRPVRGDSSKNDDIIDTNVYNGDRSGYGAQNTTDFEVYDEDDVDPWIRFTYTYGTHEALVLNEIIPPSDTPTIDTPSLIDHDNRESEVLVPDSTPPSPRPTEHAQAQGSSTEPIPKSDINSVHPTLTEPSRNTDHLIFDTKANLQENNPHRTDKHQSKDSTPGHVSARVAQGRTSSRGESSVAQNVMARDLNSRQCPTEPTVCPDGLVEQKVKSQDGKIDEDNVNEPEVQEGQSTKEIIHPCSSSHREGLIVPMDGAGRMEDPIPQQNPLPEQNSAKNLNVAAISINPDATSPSTITEFSAEAAFQALAELAKTDPNRDVDLGNGISLTTMPTLHGPINTSPSVAATMPQPIPPTKTLKPLNEVIARDFAHVGLPKKRAVADIHSLDYLAQEGLGEDRLQQIFAINQNLIENRPNQGANQANIPRLNIAEGSNSIYKRGPRWATIGSFEDDQRNQQSRRLMRAQENRSELREKCREKRIYKKEAKRREEERTRWLGDSKDDENQMPQTPLQNRRHEVPIRNTSGKRKREVVGGDEATNRVIEEKKRRIREIDRNTLSTGQSSRVGTTDREGRLNRKGEVVRNPRSVTLENEVIDLSLSD